MTLCSQKTVDTWTFKRKSSWVIVSGKNKLGWNGCNEASSKKTAFSLNFCAKFLVWKHQTPPAGSMVNSAKKLTKLLNSKQILLRFLIQK